MRRRLAIAFSTTFGLLALGAASIGDVNLTALFSGCSVLLGLEAIRSKPTPLLRRTPEELAADREERRREREQARQEATG